MFLSDIAGKQHALDGVDQHVTFPAGSEALGAGEAADCVSTGTEGGSNWVLLAQSTGHGAAQSLQLPLQFPGAMKN